MPLALYAVVAAPQSLAARHTARRAGRWLAAALAAWLLAACGGGGSDGASQPLSCSAADQKTWLAAYVDDSYFWTAYSPKPAPGPYADALAYLEALRYTGSDSRFPADRWSYTQSSEAFNSFFTDGRNLGFGLSVAGLELAMDSSKPLYVRYVDPGSPAAAAGIQRGDRVTQIAGRSAAELIAANDFAALTATAAGQTLGLVTTRAGNPQFSGGLTAASYALVPVNGAAVLPSPGGRLLGYLAVKDMVSQALSPADAAFAQFKAAGVADVVLDLRYNGGGLVSTGAALAGYIAGSRGAGLDYARLLFNDRHTASNQNFAFAVPAAALSLPRVFVLMGRRTCSASEQVINGLRGAGLNVVTIGEASCGKPVGFQPVANCGTTYSIVNFESVNQQGAGRYFSGFTPTCAVAEDFTAAQASSGDPLMAAAARYADSGSCPAQSSSPTLPATLHRAEPGERQGMWTR
jgi:C-terminal processing protease CtpA/Prc